MRPRVIVHNAVSVNGMLTGFDVDMGLHYGVAGRLGCEADLVGSGTILAAPEGRSEDGPQESCAPQTGPGSLLVVADGRGRVKCWGFLRGSGFWGRFVSLACESTPAAHLAYLERMGVEVIVAGADGVDLAVALEALGERFAVTRVRTDSGGTLNGALLDAGLVDEVSLVVFPVVATGASRVPLFRASEGPPVALARAHEERLEKGVVWLRYDVAR